MSELKNDFPARTEATSFGDGDQLSFHLPTSPNLSDLGDAQDLVQASKISPEVTSAPEFGCQEVLRIDDWLEWMRTAYGDANWDLRKN